MTGTPMIEKAHKMGLKKRFFGFTKKTENLKIVVGLQTVP